jgi:hypothetical protein
MRVSTQHAIIRTCVSQDLEYVSVKISNRAHTACRALQIDTIAAWDVEGYFFSDSIRMFPSTCFKLPREELMYPLPDLHSSTPSFMLPIMDSKLRVTARQSRKRNMHTVTTVACIILPLPQHLSLCQLLHVIAFVTCLYMHELFHLALIIDIDS